MILNLSPFILNRLCDLRINQLKMLRDILVTDLNLMNHRLEMLRFTYEYVLLKLNFMKSLRNWPTSIYIYQSTHIKRYNSHQTYSCQTWNLNQARMNGINSSYIGMLRKLVRNSSKTDEFRYLITKNLPDWRHTNLCY